MACLCGQFWCGVEHCGSPPVHLVVLGLLSSSRACTDLGPRMCREVPNRRFMDDQIDRDGLCVPRHYTRSLPCCRDAYENSKPSEWSSEIT
jgi:hypothetical protein